MPASKKSTSTSTKRTAAKKTVAATPEPIMLVHELSDGTASPIGVGDGPEYEIKF